MGEAVQKLAVMVLMLWCLVVSAKQEQAEVQYLGNTGLLVDYQDQQVLFDPFFHNHFNTYQLVPEATREAIFSGQPPYDSVEMILVSHAHGDHFDAADLVKYLQGSPNTCLVAPTQAVEQLQKQAGFKQISDQIHAIGLAYQDQPVELTLGGIVVEAVRIPHAGWPGRAEVSNLVYRVTLNDDITMMHMGDADPDDVHFKPLQSHWEKLTTNHAFPPYWFLLTPDGQTILKDRINSQHHSGVHVPVNVPEALKSQNGHYFVKPGSTLVIKNEPAKQAPKGE